jgi:hypothetical protein
MDIVQLLTDYNIPYSTEGKNSAPGWVNVQCCWCEDLSDHLGWNLEQEFFNCWKCGKHRTTETFARLLSTSEHQARQIIKQYGKIVVHTPAEPVVRIDTKKHQLPSGCTPLMDNHRLYLEHRQFDPDQLVHDWNLLGTGPVSKLDNIDFKHRVIIPILWDGRQVSFQGRDITNKSTLRYITCPEDRELVHHKHILGGRQDKWTKTGIVVEGWFDVFRFGLTACCTFGIKYTKEQLWVIDQTFDKVAVCFDDEPQATEQANRLVKELIFRGHDAWRVPIVSDPGAMKQDDADYLIKQILK